MLMEERLLFEELTSYQERLNAALKASRTCVFELDLTAQRHTFLANTEDIFGIPAGDVLRDIHPFSRLSPAAYRKAIASYFSHPDDAPQIQMAFDHILRGQAATFQVRMRAGDSRFTWCKLDVTPIFERGTAAKMIWVISDINEIKAENERLERLARMDSFLDIYNKATVKSLIQSQLQAHPAQRHALVLFDLDHFKEINDSLGHIEGDRVLVCVSEHLKAMIRPADLIGRFGGDEFILFLTNLPSQEFLLEKLHQLLQCDNQYHVTKSIGVSLFPTHATDLDTLFSLADQALYQAKQIQNTYTIYSPSKGGPYAAAH